MGDCGLDCGGDCGADCWFWRTRLDFLQALRLKFFPGSGGVGGGVGSTLLSASFCLGGSSSHKKNRMAARTGVSQ